MQDGFPQENHRDDVQNASSCSCSCSCTRFSHEWMNESIYLSICTRSKQRNATRRESKEQGFQAPKTNTCRHYLVCNSRDVCRDDSRVSRSLSLSIYTQQILEQQSGHTQQKHARILHTTHNCTRARSLAAATTTTTTTTTTVAARAPTDDNDNDDDAAAANGAGPPAPRGD